MRPPAPATAVRYEVFHDTHYRYAAPVSLAHQLAHLWPRDCVWQRRLAQSLEITPSPTQRSDGLDVFGNPLTRLAFERPHDELRVSARLHVEVLAHAPSVLANSPAWDAVAASLRFSGEPFSAERLELCRYRVESPYVRIKRQFSTFSTGCFAPGRPLLEAVAALMAKIYGEFAFDAEATHVATPLTEVLERRRGVCQDFAHLMLACLRSHGLAARYVSGYLLTQPPPGQPRLTGADASHAWVSVYCPRHGWVDFDPTNNVLPDLEHITLAWGRDFSDVSPLRGVILGGGSHDPDVRVTVLPLVEIAL
ncbi:transglutaminase family protein [Pseudomonas sp. LS44]|uniref:transglutaminase family protein n=1 Tax=Pseudomonas sp. LS44 TaxID=1357074 RepID=UPI00215A9492|nr:transglutaminase family protein [Pseudomonas sp. LS44]UVE17533.1 transglutaminase family protein [Pseudomonas sp. LS44]